MVLVHNGGAIMRILYTIRNGMESCREVSQVTAICPNRLMCDQLLFFLNDGLDARSLMHAAWETGHINLVDVTWRIADPTED